MSTRYESGPSRGKTSLGWPRYTHVCPAGACSEVQFTYEFIRSHGRTLANETLTDNCQSRMHRQRRSDVGLLSLRIDAHLICHKHERTAKVHRTVHGRLDA